MRAYEEIIETIREQGAKKNPESIRIGTVKDGGKIQLGEITLEKEDYMISSMINQIYRKFTETHSETEVHEKIDQKLKEGDRVAVYFLKELNKYLVLCKVVDSQ